MLLSNSKGRKYRRTVMERRELTQTHRNTANSHKVQPELKDNSTVSHDTEIVLNAVKNLQISIDKRFDEIQTENKEAIKQLHDKIGEVRKEFNSRMEGLAEKVEVKVNQTMKKNVEEKVKPIQKEMVADISKITKHMKDVEKDMDKLKETIIPTVQEKLGDEIDDLRGSLSELRDQTE